MTEGIPTEAVQRPSVLPNREQRERLRKQRMRRDGFSRYGVGGAGIGVIFALALIFLYLFWETFPLLKPIGFTENAPLTVAAARSDGSAIHLALERFEEVGARFMPNGTIDFFDVTSGRRIESKQVPIPSAATITQFSRAESRKGLFVFGFSDGSILPLQLEYGLIYPEGKRQLVPQLKYPLGETPLRIGDQQATEYSALGIVDGRAGYLVAAGSASGEIVVANFATRRNMFTGRVEISRQDYKLPRIALAVRQIMINESLRDIFVIDERGTLHHFDIVDRDNPRLIGEVKLVSEGAKVAVAEFLVGSRSLIVGGSDGSLTQWFLVRDEATNISHLTQIRRFRNHPAAITFIEPEYTRKGFIVGDASGHLGIHYATSHATLLIRKVANAPIDRLAISPINQLLLMQVRGESAMRSFIIDNPHPQTSMSALWGKVWYEGRGDANYIWQSSSADDAFESKLSLVPLTVGTLKAALFAMILATPIAILGAIYVAYFMAAPMRKAVKPSIELMEALPTVILGFLAGIWLAPYIENNLPILMTSLILIPVGTILFGYAYSRLPSRIRLRVPAGYEALLLIPIVLLLGWFAVSSSPWIEVTFFDGSMRQWLTDVGIPFDQRNALIVGLAMGFAVIPTIFSIAEDAVFNVPRHLTQGSLALGASSWQTVVGVVLPTASPGIFSAVMIGFGRAVGETMIVLMASGNSPIVNFNIFEGMRTLAANIAVELPETAVGSTHFRVLFLSALVLLLFTFVLNTLAEVVRQRLRKRYASL
jgi:phosphate transport system permease protein